MPILFFRRKPHPLSCPIYILRMRCYACWRLTLAVLPQREQSYRPAIYCKHCGKMGMVTVPARADNGESENDMSEDTIESADSVYWRLYVDKNDEPCVVEMQWFDEDGYDQSRFVNDTRYGSEDEAEQALVALKLKVNVPLTTLEKLKSAAMLSCEVDTERS